jgi:hypothetical protein
MQQKPVTAREDLTTALNGGIPEHTPLSVLDWLFADPRKVLWANINVGLYGLPPTDLRRAIIAMRQRAGKRALAFAIAEDIPENWRDSVPVILQMLQELG